MRGRGIRFTGDGIPFAALRCSGFATLAAALGLAAQASADGKPSSSATEPSVGRELSIAIADPAGGLGSISASGQPVAPKNSGMQAPLGGGDTCYAATEIMSLPFADTGDTCGFADDYDEACESPATAPDVVYSFTPASDMLVDISLCRDSAYDTKLYVYEGTCTSPRVGCNDDSCSTPSQPNAWVSELMGLSLAGGTTYHIIVDGWGNDCGTYTIDITERGPPLYCPAGSLYSQTRNEPEESWKAGRSEVDANGTNYLRYESFSDVAEDVCGIHWWGFFFYYDGIWSACAESDPTFEIKFYHDDDGQVGAEACSYTVAATVEPTGLLYTDDLGDVFELNHYTVGPFDPCCQLAEGWVSIQGIGDTDCWFYWMISLVGDGTSLLSTDDGPQALDVYDLSLCLTGGHVPVFGACCHPDGTCDLVAGAECNDNWLGAETTCDQCPCVVTCPLGSTSESEACGADMNGGCKMPPGPEAFEPIACGETVCGTIWAQDDTRDTDWFEIVVAESTQLTWTVEGEFRDLGVVIGFVETIPLGSGDCADITGSLFPSAIGEACEVLSVSQCVPAGTYWLFVSALEHNGLPCGSQSEYTAWLTCEPCVVPRGACCMADGSCEVAAEAQCTGTYWGDDTVCDPNPCPTTECNVVRWASVRPCGTGCEITLNAAATGSAVTVEPHSGGIRMITVDFDGPVSLVGTVEAVNLTGGGAVAASNQYLTNSDQTLVIEFASGLLPDVACYGIDLANNILCLTGDTDCMVRALIGDVNSSGLVDNGDMTQVRVMRGHAVSSTNCQYDVNCNGTIDNSDLIQVRIRRGNMVGCP